MQSVGVYIPRGKNTRLSHIADSHKPIIKPYKHPIKERNHMTKTQEQHILNIVLNGLTAAGYDYTTVQNMVNKMLS